MDKRFDFAAREPQLYRAWEEAGVFRAPQKSVPPDAPPYVVMMPPPNVTGSLHIGHALNFTIQDILVRYHRACGHDTLWQPGTDHAGIATQMLVERKVLREEGKTRRDLGRDEFLARANAWKEDSQSRILAQLRALGASPDWERLRFTLDEDLSRAVVRVFVELHKAGLIYRDKRLVNWDPQLETALSDLEVQTREVPGRLWSLRYPLVDAPGRFIVVATTRPETFFGDAAVAVHPEDERYAELVGREVELPLVGRRIPIIADARVAAETGSGALKITPAHDFNDFEIGRDHKLPLYEIFDAQARLTDFVPPEFQGLEREAARAQVVAAFEARGLLAGIDEITHSVPHGDRSGVALEPRLTDQWFCDAQTLAGPAIEAVESGAVSFFPERWEKTYFEWMRNIRPWCISRQLWWGHRIPAWYGADGTCFVAASEEEAQAQAEAHFGAPTPLVQDADVLDTWFSSALWPFSTLGWPQGDEAVERDLARYYPGAVLVTSFDIIFFWVARMIMMGLRFRGEVPFREVHIHALVRDAKGNKMSKTRGNVIDPLDLASEYGVDAVRFTLASLTTPASDIHLDPNRFAGCRNFTTKLWNAARFAELQGICLEDGAHVGEVAPVCVHNAWILSRADTLRRALGEAYESYRFDEATALLHRFVWHEFCDRYLELAKEALQGEGEAQAETRAVFAAVLDSCLRMLHPIIPFITEAVWQNLRHREGAPDSPLAAAAWPRALRRDVLAEANVRARPLEWYLGLAGAVRAQRVALGVAAGARQALELGHGAPAPESLGVAQAGVLRLAGLSVLHAQTQRQARGLAWVQEGVEVRLLFGGAVDAEAQRKRLAGEMDKLERHHESLSLKLEDPRFLESAPEPVVAEKRERLARVSQDLERTREIAARLEAAV